MHRNVIDLKQFSKAFASQQNKQKPCPPIVLVAIFGYTHRADVTDIASIYSNVFWRQELSSFIESLMDGCIYNYHRQHNTMMSRNSVLILIQKVKKCPGIQSLLFNLVHCIKQVLNCVRNYLFPTLFYIFNSTIAPRRAQRQKIIYKVIVIINVAQGECFCPFCYQSVNGRISHAHTHTTTRTPPHAHTHTHTYK